MKPEDMKLPNISKEAFSVSDFFDWWWNGDPAPPFLYLERDVLLQVAKVKMEYELAVAKVRVEALTKINQAMGRAK